MKKFLFMTVLFMPSMSTQAQQPQQGEQITFSVSIIKNGGVINQMPKSPVEPPYVTLDDHTLYIWSQHSGFTLTLIDDSDTVVYQTYIPAGVQYDVLPATLSGSFTLVLSDDTYMYTGVIDL